MKAASTYVPPRRDLNSSARRTLNLGKKTRTAVNISLRVRVWAIDLKTLNTLNVLHASESMWKKETKQWRKTSEAILRKER